LNGTRSTAGANLCLRGVDKREGRAYFFYESINEVEINRKGDKTMALIRWDPFREMSALQERMNRLMSDYRTRAPWAEEEMAQGNWVPPVDIYETKESIVLNVELPGVVKENITLEVKDSTLTLKGEKKLEKDVKEESYHRMERTYGSFMRAFTLPSTVQQEKVKARFKDGVLEVTIPKAEEAKPKQVKVEVG
jgi:HSP20 family protein